MKILKIAVICEIINYHSGARAPLEIAKNLSKQKQQVHLYSFNTNLDQKALRDLKINGVNVKIFKKFNFPFLKKLKASIQLYKTLKRIQPQIIVFSSTLPFFIAAKISGVPIIQVYMGTQFNAYLERKIPYEKIYFWEKAINKLANLYIYISELIPFKLSTKILPISNFAKNEGENLYRRKVEKTIYLGATPFPTSKKGFLKNGDDINIISVSRITPYKGFHKIIKAIENIKTSKKVTFTIIGSQPKKHYFDYLKSIGGEKLKILIDPTDTKLAQTYQKSDIYASADKHQFFGLPITEAALFNIPAVSLNFAAAKEIIDHKKTGFVSKNQKDFSKHLEKLVNSDRLRRKMGKAASIRAQRLFNWTTIAQNYQKFLEKTL